MNAVNALEMPAAVVGYEGAGQAPAAGTPAEKEPTLAEPEAETAVGTGTDTASAGTFSMAYGIRHRRRRALPYWFEFRVLPPAPKAGRAGGAAGLPPAVYRAEGLPSPCLYGVLRPAVYLTPESFESEARLRHILAHELTHRRHLDHIWPMVRGACLLIHWFNPLVWLAAALSKRDCELACDEGTHLRLGEDSRVEYGRTLVGMMAAPRPMDLFCCATTMTGGKRGIKERIALIAKSRE